MTMEGERLDVSDKIAKYQSFVNDVLREELKKVELNLDRTNCEIAEYIQLKCFIESTMKMNLHNETVKTQVDIGCNFYIEAKITDPSTVLLSIGLGYFIEYPIQEAVQVIEKRINLLEKKTDIYKKQSANTKAHIKLVLLGLKELQNV